MLLLKSFASERSVDSAPCGSYLSLQADLYFHCASGFGTQILAYMLDSLVRVSRRVYESHFVNIANPAADYPQPVRTFHHSRTLFSKQIKHAGKRSHKAGCRILGQGRRRAEVYKASEETTFQQLSPTILTDVDPPQVQDTPTHIRVTSSTKGTRQANHQLADAKYT